MSNRHSETEKERVTGRAARVDKVGAADRFSVTGGESVGRAPDHGRQERKSHAVTRKIVIIQQRRETAAARSAVGSNRTGCFRI